MSPEEGPYWKHNFPLLEKKFPQLIHQFNRNKEEILKRFISEKIPVSKERVFKFLQPNGEFLPLHSPRNPLREAERFVRLKELAPQQNLILFGLALGYHFEAILKNPNRPKWILIFEYDLCVLWVYFNYFDSYPLLTTKDVILLPIPNKQDVFNVLMPHSFNLLANPLKFVALPNSYKGLERAYGDGKLSIEDFIKWAKVNISTQARMAPTFQKNTLENLRTFCSAYSLKAYKKVYSNVPCIIVAAGPSLEKNLHLLKKVSNQALIIAVDTIYRVLIEKEVPVDLIVSTDFTQNAKDYFLGIENPKIPLLVDPEVFPKIPKFYSGPLIYSGLEGKSLCEDITSYFGDMGTLNKGLSVAHTAFHCAEYMGTNPIILVGQDLAYSGDRTHVRGSSHETRTVKSQGGVQVDGWFGLVETSHGMKVFLDQYNEILTRTSSKVINATEGGAIIQNLERMSLRKALMTYVVSCPEKEPLKTYLDQEKSIFTEEKINQFIEERVGEIESTLPMLKEILEYCDRIISVLKSPERDMETLEECFLQRSTFIKKMTSQKKFLDLVRDFMMEAYTLKAKRFSKDLEAIDWENEQGFGLDVLKHQKNFYQKFYEATCRLRDVFKREKVGF